MLGLSELNDLINATLYYNILGPRLGSTKSEALDGLHLDPAEELQ